MDAVEFASKTALFGVGGWALENVIFGPRFSVVFNRAPVPFLPVYAAGGAAMLLARPHLKKIPWLLRLPIYGAMLSGVEYAGCLVDRKLFGACSWDYSEQSCAQTYQGCIDLQHFALWSILGVLVDGIGWVATQAGKRYRRRREATPRIARATLVARDPRRDRHRDLHRRT